MYMLTKKNGSNKIDVVGTAHHQGKLKSLVERIKQPNVGNWTTNKHGALINGDWEIRPRQNQDKEVPKSKFNSPYVVGLK